jgi:hypothetical protein
MFGETSDTVSEPALTDSVTARPRKPMTTRIISCAAVRLHRSRRAFASKASEDDTKGCGNADDHHMDAPLVDEDAR